MTPEEAARAAGGPIGAVGGRFMMYVPTFRRGTALGFPKGWAFYVGGRGGVLGDVDADVVAAAFAYFRPDWLREQWDIARGVLEPSKTAAEYSAACQDWGRQNLSAVDGLGGLVPLLQRVADAADVAGAPLFAGWRALPVPDDAPGAAAQLLMVLREHRGGMHALTVLSEGLTPLEAVVTGGGQGNAEFFNWPAPYPDPEPLRARYDAAERRTDVLAGRAYAALDENERAQLVQGVTAVKTALDG